MSMNTKLFFESIGKLGLSEAQLEAIKRLHKACFEGFERHLPLSPSENHNIHDAIQAPIATNSSHSNDMGSYKNPMTLSTNPNANRNPKEEMKKLFPPGKIVWKREKIEPNPKIKEMMDAAKKRIPQRYPVANFNASNLPMVCGYAAPNRMNYSPYKQGCAVGCYEGGGGGGGGAAGGPTA